MVTVTNRLLYNNYNNNNNNSLLNISFKLIHIFLPLILFVLLFILYREPARTDNSVWEIVILYSI